MNKYEIIKEANRIIDTGLSNEQLSHCIELIMNRDVSCDGVISMLKELSKYK
ncbi:hypothetical protein NEPAR06_0009 [Nematocida parisii]|uniref:Uncharacterized protein n=1 Tax=Nematocida parisii (strain ERTm3) TaxID=935791 RepID=I3EE33_NEMP3|nr:uncharacterized protein NEPG_00082 [Nematocida parisii ERTm1]EIJ87480.1 hypothetical protein NEQG_02361 [Nematocida parisii ERTm3]KAI5127044.1 hypothetical protein NEPAR08_0716 [Nematocida parisii]KAI5167719.1 hypothetical protein NEIRO02_2202 [Nematocida sp. AWRm79]KAI5183125.1 hypothetical protein NEIRO03_0747 [Nematocida sp. AWRm78]OAG30818.1 hypothetical protein NEIG_00302 [Nematocida sp. ERTm5]|eukprot:XP_013057916.1 hypothetical protein NEPG_00082 [Nematocida parisii ERTm1]